MAESQALASSRKNETLPKVPCDIWIAGFCMTIDHLYLLCLAHGLTHEQIELEEPLPAARRIMEGWCDGLDLIEIRTVSQDGSRCIKFLLILLVSPQLRGEEAPLELLKYKPSFAEILPTIFPPNYVSSKEEYFPRRRLPWVIMPWPLYLYITPCVRREMDKFSAKCSELARARRVASDGAAEEAAEEIPSAAEVTSVTSVDVGSEKHARSSEELGYKKGRALKDSRVLYHFEWFDQPCDA
ncbi:hypothetical protein OH76DRAFT_1403952 [Lentinus brumalis]|uniref:Uncharacterized protein n=1 Tax=Lentinus brumalis TaxID=2498619 RepID=A0A371D9Z9_9APHY|nr:hypothetical protein OH76DRAFT_1403952 [Polyporus brumalis]